MSEIDKKKSKNTSSFAITFIIFYQIYIYINTRKTKQKIPFVFFYICYNFNYFTIAWRCVYIEYKEFRVVCFFFKLKVY